MADWGVQAGLNGVPTEPSAGTASKRPFLTPMSSAFAARASPNYRTRREAPAPQFAKHRRPRGEVPPRGRSGTSRTSRSGDAAESTVPAGSLVVGELEDME